MAAALFCGSSALAQVGEGLLSVGQGGATYNVLPGPGVDAQPAFQQAVNRLALVGGGELYVLAGRYEFHSPVIIASDGITLRGSRAAVLTAQPAAPGAALGILSASGDRFVLAGLTFEDDSPDLGEQSMVQILGGDAVVRDCVFRVVNTPTGAAGPYVMLDVGDRGPASGNVPGFACEGNRFAFSAPPQSATLSSLTGLRVQRATELRITANAFTGPSAGPGYLEFGMVLDDACYGSVSGNVFRSLGDARSNAIVYVTNTTAGVDAQEGHHLVFSGNVFKDSAAPTAILFDGGHGFHAVKGNSFHRCRTGVAFAGGSDYLIVNNIFQEMIPDTVSERTAAVIEGTTSAFGYTIEGNQFRYCRTRQIECQGTDHAKIVGNQFLMNPFLPVPTHVVRIDGGSGHRIYGNSAIGFGPGIWDPALVLPNRQPSSTAASNYVN